MHSPFSQLPTLSPSKILTFSPASPCSYKSISCLTVNTWHLYYKHQLVNVVQGKWRKNTKRVNTTTCAKCEHPNLTEGGKHSTCCATGYQVWTDMQTERNLLEYENWHIDVHSFDRQESTKIKGTTGKIVWVFYGHQTYSGCRNIELRAERLTGGI
jgi:hypothetical protein